MNPSPERQPDPPKISTAPNGKNVGNIQFSIRSLLIATAIVGYFAAKLKEHSDAYATVDRGRTAMLKIDPESVADFFVTTIADEDVRSIHFENIEDADLRALMKDHEEFFDMAYQMSIKRCDLSEATFRRIAEMDRLHSLAIDDGAEVTLEELKPLQKLHALRYIGVVDPEFSEEDMRRTLPDASCSTKLYGKPTFWKTHFPPPLNQER